MASTPPTTPATARPTTAASSIRKCIDAAAGLALVLTLLFVIRVDRNLSKTEKTPSDSQDSGAAIVDEETEHTRTESASVSKPLRLAVTSPQYDDMGKLLAMLGEGYKFTTIEPNVLLNGKELANYDVVFLTCDGVEASWVQNLLGLSDRDAQAVTLKPEVVSLFRDAVRTFVENGGVLYASDWRIPLVLTSFSEYADRSLLFRGERQELTATVVDPALEETIGESIQLRFDLPGWYTAAFSGDSVQVLLRGSFQTIDGQRQESPLLVKVPHGKGAIIATSFHNEKQNSATELDLLKFLVFSSLTTRVETAISETMVRGGFSPQRGSLLTTSPEVPSVTRKYENKNKGTLSFVLAFESQGATLHLRVIAPGGEVFEKEGTSSIQIDVAEAKAGTWEYTVTAKQVPFANFPFKLTVWSK